MQITVDMTPSKAEVRKLMGGQVEILGQYVDVGGPDLNVVVRPMKPRGCLRVFDHRVCRL